VPLVAGTRLGPYEVLASLGKGGMGEVYRARDTRLARDVAVKVLPSGFAEDESRVSRFEHEARAAGALNHPNLLTVHDVGRHEDTPYLVTELLEGSTLRAWLDEGPIPLPRALDFAIQIARGLAAAHDRGIVHRDVKPENLFVTKDERVKLLDFGLAKMRLPDLAQASATETFTSPTRPGVFIGTVGYAAPEQVRGEPADTRSDIFAFGAVLYEMLTGRRAFRGMTAIGTLNAILSEQPPDLGATSPGAPLGLDRIVFRCLEKDPERRFRSAHDLGFALEGLSTTSAGASAASPVPRRRRRSWPWLVPTTLALIGGGYLGSRVLPDRPVPSFQRLTFRRGVVQAARFSPDGRTILYSAAWDGDPIRAFSTQVERPESARLDLPDAEVDAISSSGEMLVRQGTVLSYHDAATLARVPVAGGAPRPIAERVVGADWGPDGSIALVRVADDGSFRLEYPAGHQLYENRGLLFPPRVSPDGSRVALYASHEDGDAVMVVDRAGQRSDLVTGLKWHGRHVAWSPAGDEVWFASSAGGYVHPLRAVGLGGKQRVLLNLPGLMMIDDVAPDGRVLLAFGQVRIITKCRPAGAAEERDMSWFEATSASALSPDGRTVLLAEHGSGGGSGADSAVYLRNTDGSPPVRLGDGFPVALSPDGRWVVTHSEQSKPLDLTSSDPFVAGWYPDSRHLLLSATVPPGSRNRCYSFDTLGGALQLVTPEGFFCPLPPAPDGRSLLVQEDGSYRILTLADGQARPTRGLASEDVPLGWGADSRSLLVQAAPLPRARIDRLDLITGVRRPLREVSIADPAGFLAQTSGITVGLDGSYCYTHMQVQADLYLLDGIR
jgi:serine/threonine protein kinase/Tol biopolymer transport system component